MSEHGNSSKSSDLKNQNVLEISEIADLGKTIFVLFNKKPVKDKPIENKPNSNNPGIPIIKKNIGEPEDYIVLSELYDEKKNKIQKTLKSVVNLTDSNPFWFSQKDFIAPKEDFSKFLKKIETNFKIFEEKKKGSSKNIKPNQKSNKNKKNSNESFSEESESDKPNICKKYVKPDKKQIYKPKDLTPELSEESETEVIKTERILPKEFSEAGKISNSEIKTIRDLNESLKKYNTNKSQYFISDIKDLKKKAEEYKNPKILESLGAAAKIYRFRAVKGDGNCSYRSVAFLYLEQIFMNIKHLSDLKNKKTSRFFSNIFDLDFKVFINENREKNEGKKKALNKNFVETLKKYMVSKFNEIIIYRLKNKFMDKEEFSIFFVKEINENPIFDLAIIAMIRTMARNYFVKHNEIYKFFIEENKNLDKMIGELDLEGEHIIIKVISDLLEIKINIVEIEKELKNFEPLIPEIIDRNLEEIYLFYRAGHYECLCKYENNENREKKLKNPKEKENKTKLENMYCNECECIKSQCIKSRKCDHLICVDCICESNQATKKNIQCLVCGIDMMTMEEFLNNLTNK